MREPFAVLDWLVNGGVRAPALALVMAHPDDETVGAGARLQRFGESLFVFLTDGAPRDLSDARVHGFADRASYARARRGELGAALSYAGIAPEVKFFNCVDQEACAALSAITRQLASFLKGRDAVLTHPYEGGHPDHDTSACAVQLACRFLERDGVAAPVIVEMTSYHAGENGLETGAFIPCLNCHVEATAILSAAERRRKRRLFACYRTQRSVLANFAIDVERFRLAPRYDFRAPPHAGQLYYESLNWNITGSQWRALARAAEQEILCN